jgi:TRAP-type C4-dicarboxylate transport system substrate-binding protein
MIGEKFFEVTKFYTLNGIFNNTQFVCVSKQFMSKLSSQDQAIVRQAGLDGGAANATATFNAQSTNVASLTTDGMQVGQMMDRSAFIAIAQTVWTKDANAVGGLALIQQAQNAG